MAITKAELGERIRALRDESGLTQKDLAEKVETLDQSKLSRVEKGERGLTSLELADLADALGVAAADIISERPLRIAVAARADRHNQDDSCAAALARVETLARIRRVLADVGFPEPERLEEPWSAGGGREVDKGRRLAEQARQFAGVGTDPIRDLAQFTEEHFGLAVVLEPFGQGFDGLCIDDYGRTLAVVNTSHHGTRQRFTLAHELAHHLLGDMEEGAHVDRDIFQAKGSRPEMRANAFAAHLLVPFGAIEALADRGSVTLSGIARLGFDYGMSIDSLAWHATNHPLVTEDLVTALRQTPPKVLAEKTGALAQHDRMTGMMQQTFVSARLAASMNEAHEAGLVGSGLVSELFSGAPDPFAANPAPALAHP